MSERGFSPLASKFAIDMRASRMEHYDEAATHQWNYVEHRVVRRNSQRFSRTIDVMRTS